MLAIVNTETPTGYAGYTWITPEMEVFLTKLNASNPPADLRLSTGLVSANYYAIDGGCYGYIGPSRGEKIPYLKSSLTLCFSMKRPDSWITEKQSLIDQLFRTPGGRPDAWFRICSTTKDCRQWYEETKMGVYKKAGFSFALSATRMIPGLNDLTESEFACYGGIDGEYNFGLVEVRPWTGDANCIRSYSESHFHSQPLETSTVTLSIINCDLERNTPMLLEILRE